MSNNSAGRFSPAADTEDNSVATSNPEYIGVDAAYQNSANPLDLPLASENAAIAAKENKAKEFMKPINANVGGYSKTAAHPSTPRSENPGDAVPAEVDTAPQPEPIGEPVADDGGSSDDDGDPDNT